VFLVLCSCSETKNKNTEYESTEIETLFIDGHNVDSILVESDELKENILDEKQTLQSIKTENKKLKQENNCLKDTITNVRNELKIITLESKQAKKKNFIQKVFNIAPDSITTLQIDTIQ
jgi:uncharacterized protein (DUF3084 family)